MYSTVSMARPLPNDEKGVFCTRTATIFNDERTRLQSRFLSERCFRKILKHIFNFLWIFVLRVYELQSVSSALMNANSSLMCFILFVLFALKRCTTLHPCALPLIVEWHSVVPRHRGSPKPMYLFSQIECLHSLDMLAPLPVKLQ